VEVRGVPFEILTLLGIGFVGTLIWVISAEAAAIYYGVSLGWPALLVGLVVAAAQTAMYAILYLSGDKLLVRWAWLGRQVERVRVRYDDRLQTGYLAASGVASVLGMPPAFAPPVLAPSFRIRMGQVLPVMFCGRFVRFTILACAGGSLAAWFGA
jgi:hypothetical protein